MAIYEVKLAGVMALGPLSITTKRTFYIEGGAEHLAGMHAAANLAGFSCETIRVDIKQIDTIISEMTEATNKDLGER